MKNKQLEKTNLSGLFIMAGAETRTRLTGVNNRRDWANWCSALSGLPILQELQ